MEKIVHLYGRAKSITQNTDTQIIIIVQNPYKLCTNSARIVLFSKNAQKYANRRFCTVSYDFVHI